MPLQDYRTELRLLMRRYVTASARHAVVRDLFSVAVFSSRPIGQRTVVGRTLDEDGWHLPQLIFFNCWFHDELRPITLPPVVTCMHSIRTSKLCDWNAEPQRPVNTAEGKDDYSRLCRYVWSTYKISIDWTFYAVLLNSTFGIGLILLLFDLDYRWLVEQLHVCAARVVSSDISGNLL